MACLREQAPDGRVGIVSCDEEGCLFGQEQTSTGETFARGSSEADCVLQLRLRAGDPEETEGGVPGDEAAEDTGPDRDIEKLEQDTTIDVGTDAADVIGHMLGSVGLPPIPKRSSNERWVEIEDPIDQFAAAIGIKFAAWERDWLEHYGRGEKLIPWGRRSSKWVPRDQPDATDVGQASIGPIDASDKIHIRGEPNAFGYGIERPLPPPGTIRAISPTEFIDSEGRVTLMSSRDYKFGSYGDADAPDVGNGESNPPSHESGSEVGELSEFDRNRQELEEWRRGKVDARAELDQLYIEEGLGKLTWDQWSRKGYLQYFLNHYPDEGGK